MDELEQTVRANPWFVDFLMWEMSKRDHNNHASSFYKDHRPHGPGSKIGLDEYREIYDEGYGWGTFEAMIQLVKLITGKEHQHYMFQTFPDPSWYPGKPEEKAA